jgi:hypothetical protein
VLGAAGNTYLQGYHDCWLLFVLSRIFIAIVPEHVFYQEEQESYDLEIIQKFIRGCPTTKSGSKSYLYSEKYQFYFLLHDNGNGRLAFYSCIDMNLLQKKAKSCVN